MSSISLSDVRKKRHMPFSSSPPRHFLIIVSVCDLRIEDAEEEMLYILNDEGRLSIRLQHFLENELFVTPSKGLFSPYGASSLALVLSSLTSVLLFPKMD